MPDSVSIGFGTLSRERARYDDLNDTPQPICDFQVSFPLLKIGINQDKPQTTKGS